jgi:SAM-dependent methyltransferase
MSNKPHAKSYTYYNQNADKFFNTTVNADMSELYQRFFTYAPSQGRILDAGCGSGRDTKAFIERGYQVVAFDASQRMVEMSSAYTGQATLLLRFDQLEFREEFDAVWACASLLHVPDSEIDDALTRLNRALVPGGTMFIAFKYGAGEQERRGRWFSDYNEERMQQLLARHPDLTLRDQFITGDARPDRNAERWINVILSKTA